MPAMISSVPPRVTTSASLRSTVMPACSSPARNSSRSGESASWLPSTKYVGARELSSEARCSTPVRSRVRTSIMSPVRAIRSGSEARVASSRRSVKVPKSAAWRSEIWAIRTGPAGPVTEPGEEAAVPMSGTR